MATWNDAVKIAETLPETTSELWYGRPALKVRGKGFFAQTTQSGVVSYVSEERRVSVHGRDSLAERSSRAHESRVR